MGCATIPTLKCETPFDKNAPTYRFQKTDKVKDSHMDRVNITTYKFKKMDKPNYLETLTKEIESIKLQQFGDFIRVMSVASENNSLIQLEDENYIKTKYNKQRE